MWKLVIICVLIVLIW